MIYNHNWWLIQGFYQQGQAKPWKAPSGAYFVPVRLTKSRPQRPRRRWRIENQTASRPNMVIFTGIYVWIYRWIYRWIYDDLCLDLWWFTDGFRDGFMMIYRWGFIDGFIDVFTDGLMMIYSKLVCGCCFRSCLLMFIRAPKFLIFALNASSFGKHSVNWRCASLGSLTKTLGFFSTNTTLLSHVSQKPEFYGTTCNFFSESFSFSNQQNRPLLRWDIGDT